MCDPFSAALVGTGMALSAGGTYLGAEDANRTAKRVDRAKNQAYREGIDRQEGYANEASQAFTPMVENQGADSFIDQLAESSNKRLQAFGQNQLPDYSVPGNAPKNVRMAREQAFGDAADKVSDQNQNLATLSGYGDVTFNQGLDRNEYARAFGNLSDKAGRDSNLIQLDMQSAANNANRGPSIWPTLMTTLGQGMSMYGSAGTPGLNTTGASVARPSPNFQGPMPKQPHFGGYGPF